MKKIGILIVMLIFPFFVHAEVNYNISDYYVSSEIEIAGGLKIKELIVLDGTFNGYQRDIVYKNSSLEDWKGQKINFEKSSIYAGSSIENLQVATFKINEDVSFANLEQIKQYAKETSTAVLGDSNVYTTQATEDGLNVKMYRPANKEKIAFYLEYVITNAVVIHNDVAELYFPFIGDKFADPIKNTQVRVLLPDVDKSDNFRLWAHGPLNGEIKKIINEDKKSIGVLATISNLPAYTGFDIRLTFDKSLILIQDFLDHSNEEALKQILKVENTRANTANNKRKQIKIIYNSISIFTLIYLIGLIILWIYTYIKYDKEYKADFKGKYYREFIEDYNVEVIDYLFHKKITSNAMSASILNLIYKKNIGVEEINKSKKKKEYKFKLLNKDNLSEAESYLIDFLFETVGDKTSFTTNDLKNYASSSYSIFNTKYSTWKNKVINEGEKNNFFENNTHIKIYGVIYFFVSLIIFTVNLILNTKIVIAYLQIIPAILFLCYILIFNKRTKKGNEDYAKWKAFKNFLVDFGTFDNKELPEIALWERYMVYAVIFNIADKVQKTMNVKIKELDLNNPNYAIYYDRWLFYNLNVNLVNTINSAVISSVNSANAKSIEASGSGFGGGFSSGSGGGFSSGGGGHGF